MSYLIALLLALAPGPMPAAPSIDVQAEYQPYQKIEVVLQDAQGIPLWDDIEGADVSEEQNGHLLHIWCPPGSYKLKCTLLVIRNLDPLDYTKTVVRAAFVVKGQEEPPMPDPIPTPDQKFQVAFFLETKDGTGLPAGQRAILAGLTIRQELIARGHAFVGVYDDDSLGPRGTVPSALQPWYTAWKQVGTLPAVAIAPIGGGEIKVFPLPADAAALWALLAKGGL